MTDKSSSSQERLKQNIFNDAILFRDVMPVLQSDCIAVQYTLQRTVLRECGGVATRTRGLATPSPREREGVATRD